MTHCKECPYVVKSNHSEKWKGYVKKMTEQGFIKGEHKCHMKVKDGKYWEIPKEKNVCIGSKIK